MIQTQTQTQFVKVVWHFTVNNTNYIYITLHNLEYNIKLNKTFIHIHSYHINY